MSLRQSSPAAVCMLLRAETIDWLRQVVNETLATPRFVDGGQHGSLEQFWRTLHEAVRMARHRLDGWFLHGARLGSRMPPVLRKSQETALQRAWAEYSWSVLPWGVDGTGLMLLLLIRDRALSDAVTLSLARSDCGDLITSHYTNDEFAASNWRGAIFERSAECRGAGVWTHHRTEHQSVLVSRYVAEKEELLGRGGRVLFQSSAKRFGVGPFWHGWIEIFDEREFLQHALTEETNVIIAGDVDRKLLEDSASRFERIVDDPLRDGIEMRKSASWIYIPATEQLSREIYLHRDPLATQRLLKTVIATDSPQYQYICGC